MARRRNATPKFFEKYPGVYQRTTDTWTTRYYNRKSDPVFQLYGLHTAADDMNKKDGSSPYLANIRHMGEREEEQRAQAMSRLGADFMATLGESTISRDISEAKSYVELYEGKIIEWELNHTRRLTRLSLHLFNKDYVRGFLKLTIRDYDTKEELSNCMYDLALADTRTYAEAVMRMIKTVGTTRLLIRAEIVDDVTDDEPREYGPDRRALRILCTPYGRHNVAVHDLPNTDESLREIPFEFTSVPNIPMTGYSINGWQSLPRSMRVRLQGRICIVFPVKHDGIVELYKMDLLTRQVVPLSILVDPKAKAVRFAIAEGYLYYVDGYSPLRRINRTTLLPEDVVPLPSEIEAEGVSPASLTAKAGASLIKFLTNRLYLSGFEDDPNLVIYSLIDSVKPRFEQYNDKFYSPDQSPEASASNPITSLNGVADYLVVFRLYDLSLYTPSAGLEDGQPIQVTPEGAALGVLNPEAVAEGKNNLFFFNPIEGVVRFAGSTNRGISIDVENIFKRIKHKDKVFMIYHNKRLRFYFSYDGKTPDKCLYYYSELEGRLPWYMDKNTPVVSAVGMPDSEDIIAIHSEVPTVMSVDKNPRDFDSYIEAEYHTQYRTAKEINGWTYIRRAHVHELADTDHSFYVGIDTDHQDQPIVWRKFIEKIEKPESNPDAVFKQTAESGISVISLHMFVKCRRYQLRFKRYCYKDQAEILGAGIEYGDKEAI